MSLRARTDFLRTWFARSCLIGALGVWPSHALQGANPASVPATPTELPALSAVDANANQALADTIARTVRGSGTLRRFTLDVVCSGGIVEVSGVVTDPSQREEVVRLIESVRGVERVVDRLVFTQPIRRVQAESPSDGGSGPATIPPLPPTGSAPSGSAGEIPPPGGSGGPLTLPPATEQPSSRRGSDSSPSGSIQEPVPIFQAPAPGPYDMNQPKMPPYSWPTYAPYNNVSRVAYPEAYPYNQFPYIGPTYPFPKVPLGWRSVKLEWDDGYWWFSKTACKHDWWRMRFW